MEADMKKFISCFAILAMVFMVGCSNGSIDNNDGTTGNDDSTTGSIGSLKSLKNTGIRSLFTSSISINNGTSRNIRASAETDIKTLSYINASGQNVPIIFLTSNDKEVLLQINNVQRVGNKRLVATYSAIYEVVETGEDGLIYKNSITTSGKTLINIETGVLYDFSGYTNEFLVDGDTLYAIKEGGTLYKIDLANIASAIPLNNPQYNSVNKILFKIGNKIICNGYSFDANASFVPKQVLPVVLTDADCVLAFPSYPFEIGTYRLEETPTYFIDSNDDIWFYWIGGFNTTGGDIERQYIICKLSIDDEGQLSISEYSENALSFTSYFGNYPSFWSTDGNSRYFIADSGIAIVKRNPSGIGIIVEGISKTISASLQDAFINGNYIYWIDETSIKRMELSSSGTEEIIYSNSNIVNTFWNGMLFHSGDNIIFYQYFNATTVGTYSLSISNLSGLPILVSTSTMEIDNIIELQF
jgi:hypothetical protein